MRKTSKPYLILFAIILIVMSLSLSTTEWLRGLAAAAFSPIWEVLSPLQITGKKKVIQEMPYSSSLKDETYQEDLALPSHPDAISGKIIFRSPGTWNSSFWINVGAEANESYSQPIIAKNSPVLVGDSVVGIVDYVGKRQSRVRLITDSGLAPSVRVARGHEQGKAIAQNVAHLISYVKNHAEFFENSADKIALENALKGFRKKLLEKKHTWYLAKGELCGQSLPMWRTDAHVLHGSGFNYDFEDDYGPARDLRTGEPIGSKEDIKAMPLIKVHDLLITTGLDGVFPQGLKVAIVTKIDLLREGDFAFEIEAKPTLGNLDDLTYVSIIAPLGYDEKDQPQIK